MLSMLCAFWMIYIYTLMDCPWFTKHIYMLMWMMSFKKTLTTCVYLFCLSCLCLVLLCCARPLLLWFVGPLLLLLVFLYVSLGIASLLPMFVLLCVPICCTSIAALSFPSTAWFVGAIQFVMRITGGQWWPMRMIYGQRLLGHWISISLLRLFCFSLYLPNLVWTTLWLQ